MAIDPANANPPTNQLSFQNIIDEFGENSTKSLGGYRMNNLNVGGLTEIPLDADTCGINANSSIPVDTQEIKFSDFYNSRLNVLVDCYTSNQNRVSAKDKYTSVSQPGNYRIIGPKGGDNSPTSESPPSNTGGKKITILVNKQIGSQNSNNTTVVALRTGTWTTGTDLRINVRNSGLISGAGGNGGTGGPTNVPNGEDGTSAIGIDYVGTTKLIGTSGAKIQNGYGGGGGGGWASGTTENGWNGINKPTLVGQGSGGGGGAGIPAGVGGQEPAPDGLVYAEGNNGGNGAPLLAGNGGTAGGDLGHGGEGGYIGGGAGGRGADTEQTALGGNNGEVGGGEWQWGPNVYGGGNAGENGYAIVKTSNKTLDTSGYAGSLVGGTQNANPT
tara:strand:- start:1159 stop:2316 length:1158 start_codon:yes stop_codon:yes gene_type:complete